MTDTEAEPSNESGIRKFIRGILPHWPRSSSQGGNTPTQHDSNYTENDETNSTSSHELKRKSSQLRNYDDSEDSDFEENLPSNKRQRVTVSAMRRLFAKFTLSEKDTKETSSSKTSMYSETIRSLANGDKNHQPSIPYNSSESELPALLPTIPNEESRDLTARNSNNNEDNIPNMNKCSSKATIKRDTSLDATTDFSKGKKQKLKHDQEKSENQETQLLSKKLNKPENTNKRHADISDSDDEENKQSGNKAKRTRRLRRGLRLCTNITCYIEQVIYN